MNGKNVSVGQTFRVTNPDHHVLSEMWQVMGVDDPEITFSVTKYWVRDIAYIPISSTETVVGRVYQENEQGLFLAFPTTYRGVESGIILKGETAYYIIGS